MLAEPPVGNEPAEERRKIDEAGIKTVDLRGERLHAERAEDRLQCAPERGEPHHGLGVARQQQVLDHVEDEERAHPVVREALPHLGREQEREAAWMAEEVPRALPSLASLVLVAARLGNGHHVSALWASIGR